MTYSISHSLLTHLPSTTHS